LFPVCEAKACSVLDATVPAHHDRTLESVLPDEAPHERTSPRCNAVR
jgi:hypothetical protein